MTVDITQMRREIFEIPAAVERLLIRGGGAIAATAAMARDMNPPFLLSVARGSSDHASTVEALAVQRGIDPDAPRHLNKVTETV